MAKTDEVVAVNATSTACVCSLIERTAHHAAGQCPSFVKGHYVDICGQPKLAQVQHMYALDSELASTCSI